MDAYPGTAMGMRVSIMPIRAPMPAPMVMHPVMDA
jgi:hypothetical protein